MAAALLALAPAGVIQDHLVVWSRPEDESAPAELALVVQYHGGYTSLDDETLACQFIDVVRVELPPGEDLARRVDAVFGGGMRRLPELGESARVDLERVGDALRRLPRGDEDTVRMPEQGAR